MFRVVMTGSKIYAYELNNLADDFKNIERFVEDREIVIIVGDLDALIALSGIEIMPKTIQLVGKDEEA